ncbi:hypothetical protein [Microbacterium aurantiacum]|uniref:hypothetical protein n=1 Tax=Microbacterium aurantiacum TaxID=162393 RepID=UPI004037798E
MTTVCVVAVMWIVVPGMISGLCLNGNSMTLMIIVPGMLGVVVATVSTMVGMGRVRHRVAVERVGILVEPGRFAAGRICRHGRVVVVRVWVGHDDRFRSVNRPDFRSVLQARMELDEQEVLAGDA